MNGGYSDLGGLLCEKIFEYPAIDLSGVNQVDLADPHRPEHFAQIRLQARTLREGDMIVGFLDRWDVYTKEF